MPAPLLFLAALIVSVTTGVSAGTCATLSAALAGVAALRSWRWCALMATAGACAIYGAHARAGVVASPLVAALEAVIDDRQAPPVWLSGDLLDDAVAEADGVRMLVAIDGVRFEGDPQVRRVRGRAQLSVSGAAFPAAAAAWRRGRHVRLPALVRRPQTWRNPGATSPEWQRLRRGNEISGSVKSAALVEVSAGGRWAEWGGRAREFVRHAVRDAVPADASTTAAVIIAILIGDRTGLDDETIRRLQMAGTYHVIAISGGNIAILAITCAFLLRLTTPSPRVNALVTLFVVCAYCQLVGDQASVMRAEAAAVVVLGLQAVGWVAPAGRIFLLAALGVGLVDPLTIVDVGAWLSFGATAGILVFGGPIAHWLVARRLWAPIAGMLAATAAAELILVPVSAAVFGRVSVAGLLLNFFAIPAMAVTQLAGMAIVMLTALSPGASHAAATVAHLGATTLIRSADLLTVAPWLSWQTPPVAWGWTTAYYTAMVTMALPAMRDWHRPALGVLGATALVIATGARSLSAPAERLAVTMLDVGQGQAIVVQFPTGQTLLLDAGGAGNSFDIGARVVKPALWALGVRRLDWLAITHGDVDHAGGAASVLRDFEPREVWEGIAVPRDLRMQALRAEAQRDGVVWRRLLGGHTFEVGSVAVDVLSPPVPDWERRDNRNDDSLVVRVRYGEVAWLLTGDIEGGGEASLSLDRHAHLRFLSAPHHGSRTSSTPGLLRGWLPQGVLISAGRGNSFGHPAPDVLARYRAAGIEVFRTDMDGAIRMETDGRSVHLRAEGGRTWQFAYVDMPSRSP